MEQGEELAKSELFQKLVHKHHYILETTGSDSSFQIGLVELLHRAYGEMMRIMLDSAGLPKNTGIPQFFMQYI